MAVFKVHYSFTCQEYSKPRSALIEVQASDEVAALVQCPDCAASLEHGQPPYHYHEEGWLTQPLTRREASFLPAALSPSAPRRKFEIFSKHSNLIRRELAKR